MLSIALYHFHVTQIKRSAGQSAIASAAYRSGEKLHSEYYGEDSDYTKKGGVICSEILLPPHAPPSFSDRETLWNEVEKAERGKKAQLAYSFDIALQNEFSMQENIELARQFLLDQFVSRGMVVDFAVHSPDKEDGGISNPHFHVMCPIRPLDEHGRWGNKQRREYLLDEHGERIRDGAENYVFNAVPTTDWGSPDTLEHWRQAWADLCNQKFAEKELDCRIDHRSYERQGIDQLPTVHVGVAASQMEKKGVVTDRGEINRMIRKTNRIIREIRGYIDELREWLAEVFRTKRELQAAPRSPDIAMLLTKYLSVERKRSRKYSVSWQQKHSASELQKISRAIVYLQAKGVATLDDLDAALSAVDGRAKALNESVKTKEGRMKKLQKLIEQGGHYNRFKPVHDELKTLKNGWGKKREKFEREHESDLIIWNAANRYLHANLPEGTRSLDIPGWQREYNELKAQTAAEYEELKAARSEVRELQQIRRCIDAAERCNQQGQKTPQQKKQNMEL